MSGFKLTHYRIFRRVQEIGYPGVRGRLLAPLHARWRAAEIAGWRERFSAPLTTDALLDALQRVPADGGEWSLRARLRKARAELAEAPFFLDGRAPELREAFSRRHPDARRRILDQAELVLAGDLSWVVPGGTPDWHAALPWGGRWPVVAPDELGIGAAKPLGDVRLSWEVGRSTHLVRLAQAAWLTGEDRFARALADGMRSFAAENPPGFGIAWAHAQEAAIRAVAWVWCFRLAGHLPAFDESLFELWLRVVLAHGCYVESHLSNHVITHNHLISELGGLAILGVALPALKEAARWRELGFRLLTREILKQVDEEGVQSELSVHYHAFVFDSCIAAFSLADRAGLAIDAEASVRVQRMAEFVAIALRPDGTLPPIGDTDAGRAWRLGLDPLDRRDVLAAAAVLFGRGDLGAIAGDAAGAFFLTGGAALPPPAPISPGLLARRFEAAGLGIARTDFGPASEILLFRAGATRFRRDVMTSHAHADALSLTWRLGPHDLLVDPGVAIYSEGEGWRTAFRTTAAHSCIVLDGHDQADVRTHRFGVLGLQAARWLAFEGSPRGLCADAIHPAEGTLRVRRRVEWAPGGTLVLYDEILGEGRHRVEQWFQLPMSKGMPAGGAVVLLDLSTGIRVRIESFAESPELAVHRPQSGDGPGPGWRAPRYGTRVPGTAVCIQLGERRLPTTMVTVLQAWIPGGERSAARVERRDDEVLVRVDSREISFPRARGVDLS